LSAALNAPATSAFGCQCDCVESPANTTLRFLTAVTQSIERQRLSSRLQVFGAILFNCGRDRLERIIRGSRAAEGRHLIFFISDDYGELLSHDPRLHVRRNRSLQ